MIFEPVLAALSDAGVRHVVVGGVAVVLHGHPRLTADIDIALDLSIGAPEKAVRALAALGLVPLLPIPIEDFADAEKRSAWVRDRNLKVFSLWDPNNPLLHVDLFAEEPMPFDQLWERSVEMVLGDAVIHVASLPDLIEMKVLAGRPQDLADIQALGALHERRGHD